MSVYIEFVCETCRERHPIPRFERTVRDEYFNKLKAEHEAKGHITNSYNDVAPDERRGDDLWMSAYMNDAYLWCKDYYQFSLVKPD